MHGATLHSTMYSHPRQISRPYIHTSLCLRNVTWHMAQNKSMLHCSIQKWARPDNRVTRVSKDYCGWNCWRAEDGCRSLDGLRYHQGHLLHLFSSMGGVDAVLLIRFYEIKFFLIIYATHAYKNTLNTPVGRLIAKFHQYFFPRWEDKWSQVEKGANRNKQLIIPAHDCILTCPTCNF